MNTNLKSVNQRHTGHLKVFSPLPGSSSWMWPCVHWRLLSPPGEPAVCPTAAGSSLDESHTSPRCLPCVPPAAALIWQRVASVNSLDSGHTSFLSIGFNVRLGPRWLQCWNPYQGPNIQPDNVQGMIIICGTPKTRVSLQVSPSLMF